MSRTDKLLIITFVVVGLIGAVEVFRRPHLRPDASVLADSGRFDYVNVISSMFLYQGNQGVLLMDKRNGNVWFIPKGNEMTITFRDPVFVTRLPLEKLDQAPR